MIHRKTNPRLYRYIRKGNLTRLAGILKGKK